jgi:hypothetical protein
VHDAVRICLEHSLVPALIVDSVAGKGHLFAFDPSGILLHTCDPQGLATVFPLGRDCSTGGLLENLCCLRCNRELEAGHKSVAVYMFAQTVGIRPRQKSAAQRICFCPQCSVSLAMGPPPEGALNIAAWNMIRDLVGSDPALNRAAWESLRGIVGLLPATGTDGGNHRAPTGGYFEF